VPDYSRYYSSLARSIKASEIRELLAIIKAKKNVISFAGGIPDPALFPREELAEIAKEVIEIYGNDALQYSETKGVKEVRETLCSFLATRKSIKCEPENTIITTGSQSALDLVARTLIDPGDIVITENPSYLAAIGAFKNAGARLIGVDIDDSGMRTSILEEKLKTMSPNEQRRVKFIYTIPIAQNPSGVSLSTERKKHLLEIASQYDLLVVEDDPYSYLVFEESVDRSVLKALDKEERVLYMSTISKILAPGLRIGWLLGPGDLVRKIEMIKQYVDLHSPTLTQYITAEAMKRGVIDRVISRAIPHYRAKRDLMLKAMSEYFPDYTWYSKPIGGLFIFTYIYKNNFDASRLLPVAIEKYGVAYVPGGSFHVDGRGANSMRISFSYPTYEQIIEGVRRLAELIRES
jgi:2-aminoadipate transaminase